MARALTFSDARTKFANLATTNVTIGDAIQEAVDRIFEMGRWPGTTVTLALETSDFIEEEDEWFLYFEEEDYEGMIGFRDESRGWDIMDQTILFRDGVNGGDQSVVDYGTVDEGNVLRRKYRLPLNFSPDAGTYIALIKKEPPLLADDSVLPVQSLGALKCAILAVCYEYNSDEERAQLNWQKFDAFIKLAQRQTEGPKRYYFGMDSSLRRKPSQFM